MSRSGSIAQRWPGPPSPVAEQRQAGIDLALPGGVDSAVRL
jgi:hypothetical protein